MGYYLFHDVAGATKDDHFTVRYSLAYLPHVQQSAASLSSNWDYRQDAEGDTKTQHGVELLWFTARIDRSLRPGV